MNSWNVVFITWLAIIPLSLQLSIPSPPTAYEFHVAPMQCYTNFPLRKMFNILSPASILWTEMEKVDDILKYDNKHDDGSLVNAWSRRLGLPSEDHSNLVLQLGCNDVTELKSCISRTVQNYDTLKGINLNCGCPSIESGGASYFGARLMKDAELTGTLVQAMKQSSSQSSPEISVKCRVGVMDTVDEMRPLSEEQDYQYLHRYVSTMRDAGVDHVILHARPAILSGLSPVKNRIVPKLDYEIVERIASDFTDLRVTLNGGIIGLAHLEKMIERSNNNHVSSHMAGRWCLRRPLDLLGIESILINNERKSAVPAIKEYMDYAVQMANIPSRKREITTAELCLPLYLISEQLREDYDSFLYDDDDGVSTGEDGVNTLLNVDEIEDIYDVLCSGITEMQSLAKGNKKDKPLTEDVNFKRMSSSFKSIVGTKVANKWKRNRNEL